MSEYRLSDLLDMSIIQKLADSEFSASGMPMAIVDAFDGSFLVRAGSADACDSGPGQVALPIVVSGRRLATLFLARSGSGRDLGLAQFLADLAERSRRVIEDLAEVNDMLRMEISERKHFEEKLRELSEIDYLTGIFNRRKLFDLLESEIGKSHRYSRPLSLIMLDLDHFKSINDSHGHQVGDAVLKDMVQIVRRTLRKVDVFARYGGEEFMVVCAETSLDGALVLAEKIRSAMAASGFPAVGQVTVSAGVAEYRDGDTEAGLIERADQSLNAAKRQGRNQVAAV